jgi:uncharacterized protein (TIGR03086 family)
MMDLLDALDNAHRLACDRVAEIEPEQWDLPTPCGDWNVGGVALHLAIGMNLYDGLLTTERSAVPDMIRRTLGSTTTPLTVVPMVNDASRRLRARFREPGMLTKPVYYLPELDPFDGSKLAQFSVFECCIHSWDLAQALGVDGTFSEGLAQIGYDGALPYGDTIYEIGAAKRPSSDELSGDSAQARLLHLFGRNA